jgi:arylsulfatase A
VRHFSFSRTALATFLALVLLTISACETAPEAVSPTPPNVLFILTDDQGWGDLGLHGNDSIRSPNLDRLGRESVRFDRFYVSPVCAPTRASFLTGRHFPRTGAVFVTRRMETLDTNEYTLAELFRDGGYRTGLFGKWHNGSQYPYHPLGQGFERFFGFAAGHWNNYFDTELMHQTEYVPTEGYLSDILTDSLLQFLAQPTERPFFATLAFQAPHTPNQVPDRYFGYYKEAGLTDFNAGIYGMVENIDDNVGRILAHLDSLGIAENTIVIFSTDNGPNGWRYNGGMRGRKGHVDEGGVRVPFFVRWPAGGLAHGRVVAQPAAHIDLLPTLADLCGLESTFPNPIDGRSLAPLLRDPDTAFAERDLPTFSQGWTFRPWPGALRRGSRLFVLRDSAEAELYDLATDPGQQHNLSDSLPDLTRELELRYRKIVAAAYAPERVAPPIPVGYPAMPVVAFPAHEISRIEGTTFEGGYGWANDYLVDWAGTAASAEWPVQVVRPGRYRVTVQYATGGTAVGTARLSAGPAADPRTLATATLAPARAPQLPSPDRTPRGEVYAYDWAEAKLGTVELRAGDTVLRLSFPELVAGTPLRIKGLRVEGEY